MKITRFRMEGAKELDALLGRIGTEVATELGENAVEASAEYLREEWIKAAPFDPRRKPKTYITQSGEKITKDYGHLRDNIKVRKVRARKAGAIVYQVTTGRAFWGFFLELGTYKMRARPWARPATERAREQVVSIQFAELKRGIDAAMAGRSRRVLPNGRNG